MSCNARLVAPQFGGNVVKNMTFLQNWTAFFVETGRAKPLLYAIVFTIVCSAVFIRFPGIDLEFSNLFYEAGKGFPARSMEFLKTLRAIGQYFPITFATFVVVVFLLKVLFPARPFLFPPRFTVYFTSLFLLGPGLLVNLVLKPFWDRPRPVNVMEFGGRYHFLEAWAMGGSIFVNRSFVSGETAGVVCLLPLAFLVHPKWRRSIFALLATFALTISMNRIAFGAHFLSDVMISAGLTASIAVALWYVIYTDPQGKFSDEAIEESMTCFGMRLHAAMRGKAGLLNSLH